MKTIRRTVAHCALVAAISAGTLTGLGATASAAQWDSCDLSVKVDELHGFDTNNKYNIIVWKQTAEASIHLNGVVITGSKRAIPCGLGTGQEYHWAMFKTGDFVRQGDGGYRNWAFFGRWSRPSDKHVIFKPR